MLAGSQAGAWEPGEEAPASSHYAKLELGLLQRAQLRKPYATQSLPHHG